MFTDDCVIDSGAIMGRHEGQAGARQFADMLAKTPVRMRHYVTNVRVTGDGDTAHAESYVLAMVGETRASCHRPPGTTRTICAR